MESYDVEFTVTRPRCIQHNKIITVEANDKVGAQVKAYTLLTGNIDVDGCRVIAKVRKHKD